MQAGYVISGIAHAGFIGWALFGGWIREWGADAEDGRGTGGMAALGAHPRRLIWAK